MLENAFGIEHARHTLERAVSHASLTVSRPGPAWCSLAWLGLAWPGLAWLGLARSALLHLSPLITGALLEGK